MECGIGVLSLNESIVAVPSSSLKDKNYWDFPGGPMGKTPRSQYRGPRFDPWSGN